ncbi:MAG TPA: Rieske (2Fe-2S) protein [Polyangia bacterium]|nr:Rieske (2Fe-2S) protein [Polyangia bacterium]
MSDPKTSRPDVDEPTRDPDDMTLGPDHRPWSAQPRWRRDFPIDWPEDGFVARRDFVKFLVLTSFAFVAGQAWIAAKRMLRRRHEEAASSELKIASLSSLPRGSATTFRYPGGDDPCLLVHDHDGQLYAYSQSCTHLSCAVVPEIERGLLRCPCHEGYFELRSGKNVAGPPPRPLPRIMLAVRGDDVFAVGVETRTV